MLKVMVDIAGLVDSSHCKRKLILRELHILANVVAEHIGILCVQNLQTVHSINTIFNNAETVMVVYNSGTLSHTLSLS